MTSSTSNGPVTLTATDFADPVIEAKLLLIRQVTKTAGYSPGGLGMILSLLARPEVIELTENYLQAAKEGNGDGAHEPRTD